jgi:glyceraldehyde-3-phosphate dehydrogenase (NADP+)
MTAPATAVATTTPIASMRALSEGRADASDLPQLELFVGGRWRRSSESVDVLDPDDQTPFARVAAAGERDAGDALQLAAAAAFGRRPSPAVRSRVLARVADGLREHGELFAYAIAREGIKTIREARGEVRRAVRTLELSAAACSRFGEAGSVPDGWPDSGGGAVVRAPVGVVAAITPFNDPLNLVVHKVAPALAAANAVVLKPHEATPVSALMLAELFAQAGLAAGLLSVLPGGPHVGQMLVTDPRVRLVSFTGGAAVGGRVERLAGVKRLVLELGGVCPTIVFDDAEPAAIAPAIVDGAFAAAGQNCLHVQRLIVHRSLYADLRRRLVELTARVRVGPKLSPDTDMGPLIDAAAAERVSGMVEDAVRRGARLLCGGHASGTRYAPTLLEDVPADAAVSGSEVFGPVTVLESFETVDEAVALANRGDGGVHAGVFTARPALARELVERLDFAGVVVGGTSDLRDDALPFGGTGRSGLGREGVDAALWTMTEPKTLLRGNHGS